MKKYIFPTTCLLIAIVAYYNYYNLPQKLSVQSEIAIEPIKLITKKNIIKKEDTEKHTPKNQHIDTEKYNTFNIIYNDNQQKISLPSDDTGISNLLIANGQLDDAEKILTDSLKLDIQEGKIDVIKASKLRELYTKQGRTQKYMEFLKNLPNTIDKKDLIENHMSHIIETGAHDYDNLIPLVESEITKNIDDINLQYDLGNIYLLKGDYQKSIEVYQDAININQTNPYAYYQLGIAYKYMGDTTSSEQAFQQASSLSPEFANIIATEEGGLNKSSKIQQ